MVHHKAQRVGVFVDVQNMYYSAKNLYGLKTNFANILKVAIRGRELLRAICYVINADVRGEKDFHEALEKIGYEVRAKDLQIFFGGAKKGDWDIGIAMDVMRLASKLDVVVLVSGDGDFQDLLEHVEALGCRTEVIAFGRTASSKLKDTTHEFVDMDRFPSRFLIGYHSRLRGHGTLSRASHSAPAGSGGQSSGGASSAPRAPPAPPIERAHAREEEHGSAAQRR